MTAVVTEFPMLEKPLTQDSHLTLIIYLPWQIQAKLIKLSNHYEIFVGRKVIY